MPKCKKCDSPTTGGKRTCESCLVKWVEMRTTAYDTLVLIHGSLYTTKEKFDRFRRHMLKLEKIWRKDPALFLDEIEKLKPKEVAK